MKRVILTGASSMIGEALVEECIKNQVEVFAIVRNKSPNRERIPKSPLLHIIEQDLERLSEMEPLENKIDVFYHFAWANTSKATRNNPIDQEKNIRYTLEAIRLAKKMGCRKFIGAGSQAEYGPKDEIIKEGTPQTPEIAYGIAKYAAGRLGKLLCESYGICFIWGRIFSVYGPYDNPETMISYAIRELIAGRKPEFTAATQEWDYLYSEDAARAFYLLGETAGANGVYCIANGHSRPLKEYIGIIRDAIAPDLPLDFGRLGNEGKGMGLKADITKLVQDTGFKPEVSFQKGIERIMKVYSKDLEFKYIKNMWGGV